MASVVIDQLTKTFSAPKREPVCAVRGLTLSVDAGRLLVLVGPSGCGKSTTLRMIAGLEDITSGTVSIDGRVVNETPPGDRDVAMVFQNHSLYPHMTAFENMAFGLRIRKMPEAEIKQRVGEMADLLGLGDCLDRRPEQLSGGQRQRVALGRALVRRPRVLLLDEPLSNLDAPLRSQMRRELLSLHRRLGCTMIFVTHDQTEAMSLGGRIAVMNRGVLQQAGSVSEIYNDPANLFVAGFIGSPAMNFIHGAILQEGGRLMFVAGQDSKHPGEGLKLLLQNAAASKADSKIGGPVVLGIRPEHIRPAGSENESVISGRVECLEELGCERIARVITACGELTWRIREPLGLAAGDKVSLSFDQSKLHLFDANATGFHPAKP